MQLTATRFAIYINRGFGHHHCDQRALSVAADVLCAAIDFLA